jgi:hypothetical protein
MPFRRLNRCLRGEATFLLTELFRVAEVLRVPPANLFRPSGAAHVEVLA